MSFSDNQNLFPDWLNFPDAFGESSPSTASPASQTSPAGQNASGSGVASASTPRLPAPTSAAGARPHKASGRSSDRATSQASADGKRSKKRREWSKEERAEHATVEKKRREDFNDSLMDLARSLPKMKGVKRLNKHNVIRAAAEHAKQEHRIIVEALPDIAALTMERDALLRELNDMRTRAGLNTLAKRVEASASLSRLFQVEAETFGTFTDAVFGGVDDDRMEEESTNVNSSTRIPPAQNDLQQRPGTDKYGQSTFSSVTQGQFDNIPYHGVSFSPGAFSPMTAFLNSQELYNPAFAQVDAQSLAQHPGSRDTFG